MYDNDEGCRVAEVYRGRESFETGEIGVVGGMEEIGSIGEVEEIGVVEEVVEEKMVCVRGRVGRVLRGVWRRILKLLGVGGSSFGV